MQKTFSFTTYNLKTYPFFFHIDTRIGVCFTTIEEKSCKNVLRGVKCTRDSCCATVGAGWNIPCQRCPEKRECKRGFMKNTKTGTLTEESIIILLVIIRFRVQLK